MKHPSALNKIFGSLHGVDLTITLLPLCMIILLAGCILAFPAYTMHLIGILWNIFVNRLGFFYIMLGIAAVICAGYLMFSQYGSIRLGGNKPHYGTFVWGSMIFTSTMAADILYWSCIEWAYYYNAAPFGMKALSLTEKQDWTAAYPLFHWGLTPWSFYIVPAAAFGYMLHVKKRSRKTLSEACRPLLGSRVDSIGGKVIDIFSVMGLLAGTATTFSLATPLLSRTVSVLTGIEESKPLTLAILLIIAVVYTSAVLFGFRGISQLAAVSVVSFTALLCLVFFFGPRLYILETSVTGLGKMVHNFIPLSTWMDPLRVSGSDGAGLPQQWTIFYWAYWIAWFVATPFFIGTISEGRTIRNTVAGGLLCGIAGTYCSFMILGNYGLYLETHGLYSAAAALETGVPPAEVILHILSTAPAAKAVLCVLAVTMVAFYASTFDALTLVIASYSQKTMQTEEPAKGLRAYWALVFICLPAALLITGSELTQLQSLSIIAAFPLGIVMILIVIGFFKELRRTV